MDAKEKRLSQPVDWAEEYQWELIKASRAILAELKALRGALAPKAKTSGDQIKLRETKGKE